MKENIQNALNRLLKATSLEQEAEKRQYQEQIEQTPLEERKKRGVTWYPVEVESEDYGEGGLLVLTVKRGANETAPNLFDNGQIVSLFANLQGKQKKNPTLSGVVCGGNFRSLKIQFSVDELPDWAEEGRLGVDQFFDETTYREMEKALKNALAARNNRLAELRDIFYGEMPARFAEKTQNVQLPKLNLVQNLAVERVLQTQDALVIHGPPGTGKTTTLVEAIAMVLKTEKQVLVCAPSNLAVDLLTLKLTEKGVRTLRIGQPSRVSKSVVSQTLNQLISRHRDFDDLKKLKRRAIDEKAKAQKFKRNYVRGERQQQMAEVRAILKDVREMEKFLFQDVVNDVQVFCCTPVGAATAGFLQNKTFSTVFIDEAAQMLEPLAWIPVAMGERIIFAGDHHQLPPTVKAIEAEREGLGETLFEKFHSSQDFLQNDKAVVMLREQYRMNSLIMNYSNRKFYQNQLLAHPSVSENRIALISSIDSPVEFIDTAGCGFDETENEETKSLFNAAEAELLSRHLLNYLSAISPQELDGLKIGLISPYKEQTRLLRSQFIGNDQFLPFRETVQIDTVDGFQGQECDVIYISLVRSNMEGQIGFLKDVRRMNVAMTRAKKKLVVIGDSSTISNHPFYEEFIDYINEIDAYRSGWEV